MGGHVLRKIQIRAMYKGCRNCGAILIFNVILHFCEAPKTHGELMPSLRDKQNYIDKVHIKPALGMGQIRSPILAHLSASCKREVRG
jgi:hypothetical protein